MAVTDIDFEGTNVQGNEGGTNPNPDVPTNKDDVTHLNGNDVDDITGNGEGNQDTTNKDGGEKDNDTNNDNPSTGELNTGDQLEVDGITYTVAENGDLVDEKGNVFKEAKNVAEWLKSVDVKNEDEESSLTLASIQEAVGIKVTDENGKTIEFTDDADGVKSYIDSVIALRSTELQQAAVNRLYADNPLLKQFQDYVQINGTPRGFGELPDRSGIKLDKDNEAQLVAVIKMAAQEFGNKSLNNNYINYLRDSGGLYDEARSQLEALVNKDKEVRRDIETKAAAQRQKEAEDVQNYWKKVNNLINSRVINGYKIPDSFTKEVDGKKIVVTPDDFFDYLSNASFETNDGRKVTAYQRDLNDLSDDEFLAREMLDAWLMFTGGTYKDLIDMAVKEEQVRKLVIKSKQNRSAKSVKVVKKQTGKTNIEDIIL